MAYKNNVKVVITTGANFELTADDAVKAGQGTAAYAELQRQGDVWVDDGTKITFVPFHAIDHAVITLARTQVTDPVDDNCPAPTP